MIAFPSDRIMGSGGRKYPLSGLTATLSNIKVYGNLSWDGVIFNGRTYPEMEQKIDTINPSYLLNSPSWFEDLKYEFLI
jgi:hypothetical protein